jgi:RHS repeat-associated protein
MAYYYTRDHLGSVREMCNSSGGIVARYSYDPYGRTTLVTGSNLSTFQYTGDYAHQTSGLNLTKYRAYDPTTGRWLSRDPIAERGGKTLYEYCQDDATNLIDQLGLSTTTMTITITPAGPFANPSVDITAKSDCCKHIEFIQYVNARHLFAPFESTKLDNSDSSNSFYPRTGMADGFSFYE